MTDPAPIGHNMPPAYDAFDMALDEVYATAKDFLDGQPVASQGEADAIGVVMATAKKIRKDAEAARTAEKAPHLEASRAVDAKWKPIPDKCDSIIAAARKALTPYLQKLEAEQREEARKAREEAARLAQEAIQAQRASEGSLEAVEAAKALQRQADDATKAAARAEKVKAHVAGDGRAQGLRAYQTAEVTDRRALLEYVIKNDPEALEQWLAEYARLALPAQLPGVTILTERRAA